VPRQETFATAADYRSFKDERSSRKRKHDGQEVNDAGEATQTRVSKKGILYSQAGHLLPLPLLHHPHPHPPSTPPPPPPPEEVASEVEEEATEGAFENDASNAARSTTYLQGECSYRCTMYAPLSVVQYSYSRPWYEHVPSAETPTVGFGPSNRPTSAESLFSLTLARGCGVGGEAGSGGARSGAAEEGGAPQLRASKRRQERAPVEAAGDGGGDFYEAADEPRDHILGNQDGDQGQEEGKAVSGIRTRMLSTSLATWRTGGLHAHMLQSTVHYWCSPGHSEGACRHFARGIPVLSSCTPFAA